MKVATCDFGSAITVSDLTTIAVGTRSSSSVFSHVGERTADSFGDGMRQVVVYPGKDDHWVVICPSLPGCVSQGRTRSEAVDNVGEAIRGYVAALEEDHLTVPEDRFEVLVLAIRAGC
jgi:predicted RNase H-like HicB family nuclease